MSSGLTALTPREAVLWAVEAAVGPRETLAWHRRRGQRAGQRAGQTSAHGIKEKAAYEGLLAPQ